MNVPSVLLWGFVATIVLTTVMSAAQGLGFSRMGIPLMLGTMVTPNRDQAPLFGFLIHLVNGWLLALVYGFAFESWGRASWWLGGGIGLVHGLAVLTAVMPLLPGLHPRMASEHHGPEPTRGLEPPGFLALNYRAADADDHAHRPCAVRLGPRRLLSPHSRLSTRRCVTARSGPRRPG